MCRFGCYYFGNPLKDLRFTLVLVRAVGTLLMQKGNGALPALLHIGAAFRRITCRTPENFCSFFVEFKIIKDIRGEFPRQACSDQFYILLRCELRVFCPAVCAIRNYDCPLFLFLHLLKMFLEKLAVTVIVLVILIIRYNGTILTYGFLKVGCISPMLFSGFAPECSLRIRRILHHG